MSGLADRLARHLLRRADDGTAPLRLGQRRIYILPSRAGLLFALLLFAMLLAAINYQLALGYALVFLLAGIALAGLLHTFRTLYGLSLACETAPPVFAGECAEFPLRLINHGGPDRPALLFRLGTQPPLAGAVAADSETSLGLSLPAPRRGWLAIPEIRLSTRYPLGLFEAWCYLRPARRCLVYPAPRPSPLPTGGSGSSALPHGAGGNRDDFAGFRPRQPADPLQHVAWKISARQDDGPLLVRQESAGDAGQLHLDWADTDAGLDTDSRLGQMVAWVLAAEAAGQSYALALPGETLAAGRGEAHCQHCLERLALALP